MKFEVEGSGGRESQSPKLRTSILKINQFAKNVLHYDMVVSQSTRGVFGHLIGGRYGNKTKNSPRGGFAFGIFIKASEGNIEWLMSESPVPVLMRLVHETNQRQDLFFADSTPFDLSLIHI